MKRSANLCLIRNRRGNGMVLALFALLLISTLGVSYLVAASSSVVSAKRDVLRARALACAEAGVDRGIQLLMTGDPGSFRTVHPSAQPDNHNGDTWYPPSGWEAVRTNEYFRVCVRSGSGIYTGQTIITSEGKITEGGTTVYRTVKVVVKTSKENISVWNNVIFGGVGQAGRSINGNVIVRGSVHLLGDGENFTDLDGDGRWSAAEAFTDFWPYNGKWDPGEPYFDADHDGHYDVREPFVDANGNGGYDPPLTVTDLAEEISGTANIGNNYSGMTSVISSVIPSVPGTLFGGETVQSLKAKLRVKHGKVNISGSATIGDPNVTGNIYKESMDGLFVSDGYGGTKGATSAYGDNGTTNDYDLPDGAVGLPLVDSGAYTDPGGTTYTNYLDYLSKHATVVTGDVTIQKGVATTISGPNGSLTIDANGNMSITGIVYVTGNISFGPSKSVIRYSGSGTLVTPNSTYFHCSMLPMNQFPAPDALGLVAGHRVELATGSGDAHLDMALAMYAQHQIVIGKQCDIAGTIVSSYYSMTNVPAIYQVPSLAENLPPGMPGAEPIWIASVVTQSWQDVPNP